MHYFNYKNGKLFVEDVPASKIAEQFGTPCYTYSAATILEHFGKLESAFSHADLPAALICYSVKANSNLSILNMMKERGAGFDVVSGGELFRLLKIGCDPSKIVFAGVGKTRDEIRCAIDSKILIFNCESEDELAVINDVAGKARPKVALRVNPHVKPGTHKYIATGKRATKFGVDIAQAEQIFRHRAKYPNVDLCGVHVHIGSQITKTAPFVNALKKIGGLLSEFKVEYLDIGGGFGIWYREKTALSAQKIADALLPMIIRSGAKLFLEPGRFIVGNAGILLTRVLYQKDCGGKHFVICDAGMNDLIRPTLYGSYHIILPEKVNGANGLFLDVERKAKGKEVDIVGPICESGDFFAKDRKLPPVKNGDTLAIFSAGAYGYSMSSVYNSHPRPAEVLVNGKECHLTTRRESYEDLVRQEIVINIRL